MKAREFAYWLQGYFEIEGSEKPLTAAQAKKVLERAAKVVSAGGDDAEQKAAAYANFARGALSVIEQVPAGEAQEKVLAGVTGQLRRQLNELFVHAIDPSLPGDQQQHRQAHRPGGDGRPRAEVMC